MKAKLELPKLVFVLILCHSLGNVDLLSYQQSVGGSILSHDHATNDEHDFEDPLLERRRQKDDEEIIVPELWEIVAPVPVPLLPRSVPVLPSVPSVPPTLSLPEVRFYLYPFLPTFKYHFHIFAYFEYHYRVFANFIFASFRFYRQAKCYCLCLLNIHM